MHFMSKFRIFRVHAPCHGNQAVCLAASVALLSAAAFAAKGPLPPRAPLGTGPWASPDTCMQYRPKPILAKEAVRGFLFVETEDFEDYGRWRLDTQFTHKMGSAYLIASGVGEPIGSASTHVDIPRTGKWRVWARTKDWLPEFSPGTFTIGLDGKFGAKLGASRRDGWTWENAGDFELSQGRHILELKDISGYFGRCDAVILTEDMSYVPPHGMDELREERFRLTGDSANIEDRGKFDVVVVGAGPGGVPAAIAAAREGAKVALIGDRPVLGGNASDEIGVNMCGAVVDKPAARETGITEEAACYRARHPAPGMSGAYRALVEAEKTLTVFTCERMLGVEMSGGTVRAVRCRNTMSGGWSRYEGKVFVDATGDGWLGYYAGAKYREGREAKNEFNEKEAPDVADSMTMSGLLHEPCVGVCYNAEKTDAPVAYTTPEWANVLPPGFKRRVRGVRGQWWIEHSGHFDDCADPERARDELIRISFAYWGWLKNKSPVKDSAACYVMREVPIIDGRRESRRLIGDYILTANDCLSGRLFDDAVAYGGWSIDIHDPLGMSAPKSTGWCKLHPSVPIYTIPFRSLYSVNIPNLLMAGRDISASHAALGSTRVQSTCAVIGQAVGTAAAMCVSEGLSPRELGKSRIGELQRRLLRDDAYIPGLKNTDPSDLARGAKVTASSSAKETVRYSPNARRGKAGFVTYGSVAPENVTDGVARPVGKESHAWVSAKDAPLPQWIRLDFPKPAEVGEVRLTFDSDLEFNAWLHRIAEELVKDYSLEGSADGESWTTLADVTGNFQRHRVHRFAPRRLKSLRLTVKATYGAPEANVFEIRAYGAKGTPPSP